jgi:hypothetical protein
MFFCSPRFRLAERHHRADVLLRHVEVDGDDRLADLGDPAESGIFDGFSIFRTSPLLSATS